MKKTTSEIPLYTPIVSFEKKNFDLFFPQKKCLCVFGKLYFVVKFSDDEMFVINIFVIYDAFVSKVPVDALAF